MGIRFEIHRKQSGCLPEPSEPINLLCSSEHSRHVPSAVSEDSRQPTTGTVLMITTATLGLETDVAN